MKPQRALRYTGTAALVASITGAMLLTGCSAQQPAKSNPEPVTIVSGQSAQNGPLLKSLFADYNKSVGKKVVNLQMTADTDVQTAQKVLLDISSGHGPDAVRVTNATYQTLIDAGVAQPTDSCLASEPAVKSDLNQELIDAIKVKGHVYEVPWYVTPTAVFYNAKLFRAAGLNPDQPPQTMSEFHADAKAIAATGVGGGVAYFGNDYNFQGYVASLGGSVYDPSTGKLGIDTSAGKAAFTAFAQMAADKSSPIYTNFFTDANQAFASGKLGMIVTSASAYPVLAAAGNLDLRIAPAPYLDGGKPISPTSTNGFVITTKDPARQKTVCKALLSLLSKQAVTATVTATATIPLRTSVIDDSAYLAPVYKKNPDWVAVRDQKTFSWQPLPGKASAEYTTDYVNTQLEVLRGTISPSAAASQLQASAAQLLAAK